MAKRQTAAEKAEAAVRERNAANAKAEAAANQFNDKFGTGEKKMENEQITAEVEAGRTAITAEVVYNLTAEAIEAAIAEGEIRWAGGSPDVAGTRETALTDVTISKDKSPTKREEVQPYEKLEALTFEGMVLLAGGKADSAVLRGDAKVDPRTPAERIKGVPDHFNYGLDLEVKRSLRKDLETSISGPEKAIQKMAKALFELKLAKSMDAALAKARKQYEEEMAEQEAEAAAGE